MRPLFALVCAAVGALVLACGGGGGIGPRGTGLAGSGGSRLGVAGWADMGDGGEGGTTTGGAPGRGGRGGEVILHPLGEGGTIGRGGAGGAIMPGRGGAGGSGRGGAAGMGRGGSLGRGGNAGTMSCGSVDPPTTCPGSLCGNGVLDACFVSWGPNPRFCYTEYLSEECDGTNVGGQTCETLLGVPGGRLRCTSSCTFDTSDCNQCWPGDPNVLGCGPVPVPGDPTYFAIAANDEEVGLAAVAYPPGGAGPELSFSRRAATLDGLSYVRIADPAITGKDAPYDYGVSLAVAPRSSGWTVAGFSEGELFLHAIDADGQDAGRTSVVKAAWAIPYLVPRPGGDPLLVWVSSGGDYIYHLYVAVVAAGGLSISPPVELPLRAESLLGIGRGVFFGGAFYFPYVVQKQGGYYYSQSVRVVRVATNGRVLGQAEAASGGGSFDQPNLVAGDSALYATYRTQMFDPTYYATTIVLISQALNLEGLPTGTPIVLADPLAAGPPVGVGDYTFQVRQTEYPQTLELVRWGPDGDFFDGYRYIAQARALNIFWMDTVVRGPDIIAAWQAGDDGRLRMARVKP